MSSKIASSKRCGGGGCLVVAPGAWLQLRDALDYADATRFPVAEFGGPVERNNTARLKSVVAAYAHMGALLEDPDSASAGRHKSRGRRGINTAGWRIWPTNYGKWMAQADPTGTSLGRWTVRCRCLALAWCAGASWSTFFYPCFLY